FPLSERAVAREFNLISVVMPASTQVRPSSEWQLVSAVALERKPVITRDFNEFERRYLEMLRTMEVEASLLSDHELQVKAESQRKASADEGSGIKIQTANDIAEEWNKKAKEFQPASRLTGGLSSYLTLFSFLSSYVAPPPKYKLVGSSHYILTDLHAKKLFFNWTAERALAEVCGSGLEVRFLGNAPAGCYKYSYPAEFRKDGIVGAKVFFFKAQLQGGSLSADSLKKLDRASDFEWLTQTELESRMLPKYCQSVKSFLMSTEKMDCQHLLDKIESSVKRRSQHITPELNTKTKATEAVKA
ncbi:39S ribosomal protein L46, putative, partial [Ixodes scapularis]